MKTINYITLVLFFLIIIFGCRDNKKSTIKVEKFDDLVVEIPTHLNYTSYDTNRSENNIYKYFMNRDTIYYGSINDFYRKFKYEDSLNIYLEVTKEQSATKDFNEEIRLFKNMNKDQYYLKVIDEKYADKFGFVILSDNNQFHYLKKIIYNGKCFSIYYHAINPKDSLNFQEHLMISQKIFESIKFDN
jgi:hypothetical protein